MFYIKNFFHSSSFVFHMRRIITSNLLLPPFFMYFASFPMPFLPWGNKKTTLLSYQILEKLRNESEEVFVSLRQKKTLQTVEKEKHENHAKKLLMQFLSGLHCERSKWKFYENSFTFKAGKNYFISFFLLLPFHHVWKIVDEMKNP